MTRRSFLGLVGASLPSGVPERLRVPLHRVTDARARCTPEQFRHFWGSIWPEAARDFGRGGIDLETSDGPGEVKRSPGDRPIFVGLKRGVLNLVLTDSIPMHWDKGRALAGVTTVYDGYHVCLLALRYAHGNVLPFAAVNTCVHELLHALLQDILVSRPKWYQPGSREWRVDWYATGMWLFGDGRGVRESARVYLARLGGGG